MIKVLCVCGYAAGYTASNGPLRPIVRDVLRGTGPRADRGVAGRWYSSLW